MIKESHNFPNYQIYFSTIKYRSEDEVERVQKEKWNTINSNPEKQLIHIYNLLFELFLRIPGCKSKPSWPSGLVRCIQDPLSERTRVRIPVYPIV